MEKQIKIIIERSSDGFFWGYSENVDGINGGGQTVQDCKKDVLDGIETLKELGQFPYKKYKLIYKFDVESLLNYYKGIFTNAAFEKLTGINQKQIQHYSTGHRKPRITQKKKIVNSLHKLGEELMAVEL